MGAFEIQVCDGRGRGRGRGRMGPRVRARNVLAWRGHDRIFPKVLRFDDVSTAFHIGFAGPMYREPGQAPNADEADFVFDRRISIGDLFNEAGLPASDARALENYERQAVTWTVSRDCLGAIIDTGWHSYESRVGWGKHGIWEPDDWEIEHPDEVYHEPHDWLDCPPWQPAHDYPYCTPAEFAGWWASYQNCLDPGNYGGTCPTNPPQNPWGVECASCVDLGSAGLSAYPVGCVFVTVTRSGMDEEVFAAALLNGATWWRRAGRIVVRYRGRLGSR